MSTRFLVFTDLHYDLMKDGDERLERIIQAIKEQQNGMLF